MIYLEKKNHSFGYAPPICGAAVSYRSCFCHFYQQNRSSTPRSKAKLNKAKAKYSSPPKGF